ncbi:type IV pilus assembly protein PilN [Edaphobacter aggregans]|uniref:Type IV pilus assembly protein PilN n=1 Tax=Edaphobacter aggregans TaxID=570835 RepID=A0A428MGT3_9BACT|nr:PilN domain-containing protein [Edaphobacter aggregans]RSL16118.1 type IV pilus assembly protein PilN [Edaphobacter aggregans]
MRISVNLATRPFVELRPLFARLRLAAIALGVLAIGLGFALHSLNAKARVAQAHMDSLKAKTLQFQQERQRNEARMRQPQNMAVLERSQFLNAVFAAKSFSWTAVMMDLERVLPTGVQVTSIEPSITKEGDVVIRLRVSGDRDRAVQLVRNLETSQRFVSPRLAGEAAQQALDKGMPGVQAGPPGVEFEIFSGYNPLPEIAVKKVSDDEMGEKDADAPADAEKSVTKKVHGTKAVHLSKRAQTGGVR